MKKCYRSQILTHDFYFIPFLFAVSADAGFALHDSNTAATDNDLDTGGPVSYIAHASGAMVGFMVSIIALKHFSSDKHRRKIMSWLAIGALVALVMFCIVHNLYH